MKKLIVVLTLLVSFLGLGETCAHGKNRIGKSVCQNGKDFKPVDYLADYFPLHCGKKLVYKIELGEVEPLFWRMIVWPKEKGDVTTTTRGNFDSLMPRVNTIGKKTFTLALQVKGCVKKQGKFQYPNGVELTVEKDELGIYQDAKQVFWAGSSEFREVLVFSPSALMAPKKCIEDGISERITFFNGRPDEKISAGKNPFDKLIFKGEDSVSGSNIHGLHFVRMVHARIVGNSSDEFYINKGFEEHTYFVKGKGLVFLEQKVEGKTSMTWRLVDSEKK